MSLDNSTPPEDAPAAESTAVPPTPTAEDGAAPPAARKSHLALAALIVGIVAIVCAVIPGLSFVAFLPAIAATILGVVALVAKKPRRGHAIAGAVLGPIALLIAIIVSVSTIVVGVGNSSSVSNADNVYSTEQDNPAAETEEAAPEEPEEPAAPVIPADVIYQGVGDSIVPITLPDGAGQLAVATISHVGSSNFAVWSLDAGMAQQDLLVNTIGGYNGTVILNNGRGGDVSSLEVTADGAWTVTMRSILAVREFAGATATGAGDDVVIYRGKAGAATISHDGQSNFAIWAYGSSSGLVVNEIGPYTGTTRWTAGPSVVVVSADGNWGITVG